MFAILVAIFGGWRVWATTIFVGSLFVAFWDMIVLFFQTIFSKFISMAFSLVDQTPVLLQFQGVTAYFMEHLKFSECLTVILGVYLTKFLVRKIPLIKW